MHINHVIYAIVLLTICWSRFLMRYIGSWNQFELVQTRLGPTSCCRNCEIYRRWLWNILTRR